MASYPTGIKVYIDDVDCTYWIFQKDFIDPTDEKHDFRNIDISSFLQGAGNHKIKVTTEAGVGRVEARLKVS